MTSKAPSIYYLALYRKGVMGNILPASSVIHTVIIPHFASEETEAVRCHIQTATKPISGRAGI